MTACFADGDIDFGFAEEGPVFSFKSTAMNIYASPDYRESNKACRNSPIYKFMDVPPLDMIEGFNEPIYYGVHGGIKNCYKVEPEKEHAATLDHIVAATAG